MAGTSGWTTAGPFVIYARGEYEYAPSGSGTVAGGAWFHQHPRTTCHPIAPSTPIAATSRFRLLDAYVGMNSCQLADLLREAEPLVGAE